MAGTMRVGVGYDIHRLVSDRPLVLGGIVIDHDRGLLGHSDGDAVLHAIADALLGAAGLGDIGEHFPDTDPEYQGIDSKILLRNVVDKVGQKGFTVGNLDVIVHAERPNLSEYKNRMIESVASLLKVEPRCVNIKAKTNEGLGPVGRREGIGCYAVVLLISTA